MPRGSQAEGRAVLEVRSLNKSFGGLHVTRNVSMALAPGERRVVLGPNGAGKTTLFNLLVGALKPSSGEILFGDTPVQGMTVEQRARLGIARSYQKNNLFDSLTVRENLALAVTAATGQTRSFLRDSHRQPAVQEAVEQVAGMVALSDLLDKPVRSASYGNRRQLEVGIALASRPKVLLMDEPTSGVGPAMIEGFHRLMKSLPKDLTVLIIEHDLDLGFDVADRITVLNYGEVVFEGTPEETRASPLVKEIYLGDWAQDA